MWYDEQLRLTDRVQFGTYGALDFDRDGMTVPVRSDTALRTTTTYGTHGRVEDIEDPRGIVMRYEYDDHYFMTDPEEFIYEFFPMQAEWQLLKHALTLTQFEQLPFVRSLFFRYGLSLADLQLKAIVRYRF